MIKFCPQFLQCILITKKIAEDVQKSLLLQLFAILHFLFVQCDIKIYDSTNIIIY